MSNDNIHKLLDKLLNNSFNNLSKEEYSYLLKLFEEDNNPIICEWLKAKWEESANSYQLETEDLDFVLGRIKLQINKDLVVRNNKKTRGFGSRFVVVFQRVAAVLFVPIAIFAAYTIFNGKIFSNFDSNQQYISSTTAFTKTTSQEYYSPAGTRSKIILKDSTTIWLNSNSRLYVTNDYGRTQYRRVKLVGQAYFDVKKNPHMPFIVDLIKNMSIKVTGTVFTVGAYEDSKSIETVLISGTVYFNRGNDVVKMKPSQKVTVNREDNKLTVKTVEDDSYKSWKDGILIFKETAMPDVIATLEKWFNVSIQVQDKEIMSYKFTAKLDNCSLAQVLEYMSYSSPLQYSIKEKNVSIKLKRE